MQLAAGNAQLAARRDEPKRRYDAQFNSVVDAIRRLMTPVGLMNLGWRPPLSAVKQLDGIRESVHRGRRCIELLG